MNNTPRFALSDLSNSKNAINSNFKSKTFNQNLNSYNSNIKPNNSRFILNDTPFNPIKNELDKSNMKTPEREFENNKLFEKENNLIEILEGNKDKEKMSKFGESYEVKDTLLDKEIGELENLVKIICETKETIINRKDIFSGFLCDNKIQETEEESFEELYQKAKKALIDPDFENNL